MTCAHTLLLWLLTLTLAGTLPAQEKIDQAGSVAGPYMGQKDPGTTPQFFTEDFVNTPMDMHGNIVFAPDGKEAFWHPDQPEGLYFSRMSEGVWSTPQEISFIEGLMHDAPCYSSDGNRLFFAAAIIGASGITESDRFYVVERTGDGWSEARLLDPVFNTFSLHWQFSVDATGSLYFGGGPAGAQESSDIWFSRFANGRYAAPVKLPETIDSEDDEFSPCIAPDDSYLIFNRAIFPPGAMPRMSLYVSFRTTDGGWTESQSLDGVLQSTGQDLNARISPDGMYLFFLRRGAAKSGTYWVSTSILDSLRPAGRTSGGR